MATIGNANRAASELVWYVSYGSNLSRVRFMAYIEGGRVTGNDVLYEGCTDTRPPADDVPLHLPQSLYFAGWSGRVWGGTAGAFVTLGAHAPPALARAYLITSAQFAQVVTQENAGRVAVEDIDLNVDGARRHGHVRMAPTGRYSELLYCGERDGHPMLTFTASQDSTKYNRPSPAYLTVIGNGLKEAHGLSVDDVVTYLKDVPGVRDNWTPEELGDHLGA